MGKKVFIEENAFSLGKKKVPFLSGSLHYWRIERDVWEKVLDDMAEIGLPCICSYIPWSVHELKRGIFDFGTEQKEKDLDSFLTLAEARGLYCILRPGPHINAELTYFGYPKRLLAQEELLSRSVTGTLVYLPSPFRAFPVPSYASEKFYEELRIYFEALAPILKKHLYPKGNVIALQCDNEMSMFFRVQPYDHDYSEASLSLYRNFLIEKYGDLQAVRQAHRLEYPNVERIKPPRQFAAEGFRQLRRYLDWVEYKQYYIAYALRRIRAMWEKLGVKDILFTHNYPVAFPKPPYEISSVEKIVDIQGIDMYPTKEQYPLVKKGLLFTSTESCLPCSPEFSSGFVGFSPFVQLSDQKFMTPALFMHGLKGVNFYMFVERERWYGSPISRRGTRRKSYWAFFEKFLRMVKELDLISSKRQSDILLVLPRLYRYTELATSLISPIPAEFLDMFTEWTPDMWTDERDLQLPLPPQLYFHPYWSALYKALQIEHFPLSLSSEEIDEEKLASFKLVLLPTFSYFPKEALQKMLSYVEKGGALLTGPLVPEMDEQMRIQTMFPFSFPKAIGEVTEANANGLSLEHASLFGVHPRRALLRSTEGDVVGFQLKRKKGKLFHLAGVPKKNTSTRKALQKLLAEVATRAGVVKEFDLDNHYLDLSVHSQPSRGKILFVANPTDQQQSAKLLFQGKKSFQEWESTKDIQAEKCYPLSLSPYTIRIWRVNRVG